MRKAVIRSTAFFALLTCVFMTAKPLFMAYNHECATEPLSSRDILGVIAHGLSLDMSTSAYFAVLHFIVIISAGRRKTVLKAFYATLALLLSLILTADAMLYGFWGFKIDATAIAYLDKPSTIFNSLSDMQVAAALATAAALFSILFFLFYKVLPPVSTAPHSSGQDRHKRHARRLTLDLCAVVLFLSAMLMAMRGGTDVSAANISRAYFSKVQFLNHAAVNPVFSLGYSLLKTHQYGGRIHYMPSERADSLTALAYGERGTETVQLLGSTRPNVLLIIWEGLGYTFFDNQASPKETSGISASKAQARAITPCASKIAGQGVLFSQCYANSYRTDRGLTSILNGWPALPKASLLKIPDKSRKLPSLAKSLSAKGYETSFWYGGDADFANMRSYLHESGYGVIKSVSDFDTRSVGRNKWGVPDGIVLDSLRASLLRQDTKRPWFTTVLTLSSHEPWSVPTRTFADDIANSYAYTDQCIGEFVSWLQSQPMWDNTLVVIIPDHGVCYRAVQASGGTIKVKRTSNHDVPSSHIPLIWTGGALKASGLTVGKLMNQSDLASTLLSQLQISSERYVYSRDVLSDGYRNPMSFMTFNDGMILTDSTGTTIIDNVSGQTIYSEELTRESGAGKRRDKAEAILQSLSESIWGK